MHTNAELDGAHQLADKGEPTRLMGIQPLGDEQERAALAYVADRTESPLEEQKSIFEADALVEKGGAGTQQDDEPDVLGDQQRLKALAEQGGELMTGEGAGDVDLSQETLRRHATRLRIGGDCRDIESQRPIDDGDRDTAIDGRGGGPHGDARHA